MIVDSTPIRDGESFLEFLKKMSKNPELLPDDHKDLWPEGEIKTNYGSIEWTTLEEV
jgi:hypothetical protein